MSSSFRWQTKCLHLSGDKFSSWLGFSFWWVSVQSSARTFGRSLFTFSAHSISSFPFHTSSFMMFSRSENLWSELSFWWLVSHGENLWWVFSDSPLVVRRETSILIWWACAGATVRVFVLMLRYIRSVKIVPITRLTHSLVSIGSAVSNSLIATSRDCHSICYNIRQVFFFFFFTEDYNLVLFYTRISVPSSLCSSCDRYCSDHCVERNFSICMALLV